jgi:hypothetical protein
MLPKICILILSLGMTAGVLLHLRQARLQAVHELARVQLRMNERDRDLFRVRTQIARQVTPDRIEQAAKTFGPLTPVGVETAAAPQPPADPAAPRSRTTAQHPQE